MRRIARAVLAALALAASPPPGEEREISFDRYDPLSSNQVLAQRLMPPLVVDQAFRDLARHGQAFREQPVELAAESFRIFVPAQKPAAGYGLLVFVPPWQGAHIPPAWRGVLDRKGIILVTAARSGNAEPVLGRRDPLAILAAINVKARYPVDPARVYVGGFSGGSKVAFKLAVGYPDLFAGALLLAGADPVGEDGFTFPSAQLFDRFRANSRIVFVTGARDEINLRLADSAAASIRRACTRTAAKLSVPGLGHELVDSGWLLRALNALDGAPPRLDPASQKCRSALDTRIAAELDAVAALIARGDRAQARKDLLRIDARFGGLALPRSLALLRQIAGV